MSQWQTVPSTPTSLIHQTGADGVQHHIRLASSSHAETKDFIGRLFGCFCCHSSSDVQIPGQLKDDKKPLLPDVLHEDRGKMCLVLDLDETLVHSSFRPVPNPDYVLPVDIEGTLYHVYVIKRPGTDEFLEEMGKYFEIVVYTASLGKYADPLLDLMDTKKIIRHRLFRESCTFHEGTYVKDLTRLGRDLKRTIIVDNSPASYLFQPENAIGISSFIDDPLDRELYYCLEFLKSICHKDSVFNDLPNYHTFVGKLAEDLQDKP